VSGLEEFEEFLNTYIQTKHNQKQTDKAGVRNKDRSARQRAEEYVLSCLYARQITYTKKEANRPDSSYC